MCLNVFSAWRRRIFEAGDSSLVVRGAERDPAVARVASFLNRNRIPFREEAKGEPEVSWSGKPLPDPTPRSVARHLGLDLKAAPPGTLDLVIVGAGPAGVAAAVYVGSEGLKALVVEDSAIGRAGGDQFEDRELYGLSDRHLGCGPDLSGAGPGDEVRHMLCYAAQVEALSRRGEAFCVTLDGGEELCARSVLVATGVRYRRLPLDRLEEFEGAGVYYAATETEARFCAETEVVVVGGGNSAGQAAMYLSRVAKQVHVLVRGGHPRGPCRNHERVPARTPRGRSAHHHTHG